MFTGRSVARGGAFAGRGFGGIGAYGATVGMAVTATVIPPTATKSAPTTIGATQSRAAPTWRLLTLDASASLLGFALHAPAQQCPCRLLERAGLRQAVDRETACPWCE